MYCCCIVSPKPSNNNMQDTSTTVFMHSMRKPGHLTGYSLTAQSPPAHSNDTVHLVHVNISGLLGLTHFLAHFVCCLLAVSLNSFSYLLLFPTKESSLGHTKTDLRMFARLTFIFRVFLFCFFTIYLTGIVQPLHL